MFVNSKKRSRINVWSVIGGILVVGTVAGLASFLPDLIRYKKMRSM